MTAGGGGNSTLSLSLQSASPAGAFALDSVTGDVSPISSSTASGTYTLTMRDMCIPMRLLEVRACGDLGYTDYTAKTGDGTTLSAGQYVMIENRFEIDCCGLVTSWSLSAHNTGTLALQVWRPLGGTNYELVGENVVNVTATGDNVFNIATVEQISVLVDDVVGWYTSGAAILDWKNDPSNGAGTTTNYVTSGATASSVGDSISMAATTNHDHALFATLSATSNPSFVNLPASVTSSRQSLTAGVSIFTVAMTAGGGGSSTLSLSLQSASPAGAFALDSVTGDVSPISSSTASGTYTLTMRVTDTCGNTDDQDLTITVTNIAPTLHGLPVVADVSESAVDETLLHLINVTDADGDTVTCTHSPNLDYDVTSSYTITVTCTDNEDTVSGTVYVYVVKNNVPVILNLQNSTSITSDTPSNTAMFQVLEDTAIASTVYSVSVYDEDGSTSHSFSSSLSPAAGAGFFSVGETNGRVTLLAKLNYLTQDKSYNITVEVSDGQLTSTSWLVLEIVNVNEAPVLYQAEYQIQTQEAPAGTVLPSPGYNVQDPDGDNMTYAFVAGIESTYGFSISPSTGSISLTLDFDREDSGLADSSRVWLVRISDPAGLAVTATLTVSILDAEDNVPQLSSTSYFGSVYSNTQVGEIVTTASATDADATAPNRILEYSVAGTSIFNVDGSGNIVVFAGLSNYQDTQHTFTLTVKNPGSTSNDTATVSVYVAIPSGEGFFDKAENIAWVTIVSVVGVCILLGLAYLAIQAYDSSVSAVPAYKMQQVAPHDTKLPSTAKSSRPVTRSTVVTPSDIRAIETHWSAWDNRSWF
ncbi:hypothetical protein EGW08_006501 [Elysia chlorotica]|uniref:Cadherin domain-containing protein n=1 Tax=Elysia chlorotica TaxID=188477 RepID=A0A433TVT4_ELYCH|nr:hypothetical protein EGW08_006501 [Elysia chlorotica]